jgi:hypothetical protein
VDGASPDRSTNWCRWALALATVALLVVASSAHASKLHRIVSSITTFASDGTRYIAWEVPRQKPIFVLDSRTGRTRAFRSPCGLKDKSPAAAGRFLLECEHQEEEGLLDVRTGVTRVLPTAPPHPYAEYGPIWEGVGSRYVIGKGGTSGRCPNRGRNEQCLALYDIATRKVTEVRESQVPDPNRAGAPPLCRGLRYRVRKAFNPAFEGLGPLTPREEAYYSYSDGLFAEPEGYVQEHEPDLVRNLVLIPCKGPSTLVPVHAERLNLEPFLSPELNGDLLTWSTGHPTSAYEAEEEIAGPRHGNLRHGILGSYNLHTHKGQLWMLPLLRLHVTRYLSGRGDANVVGTFGYSAHTDYDAFWIAAHDASCTESETCPLENEVFAIYAARL